MRKTILVLASMALAVLLASGIALAATVKGDFSKALGTPYGQRKSVRQL
jgi:hypothetical protein